MADLKREIFKHYRVFRTTSMVEDDIKSLRKINNLITKFSNTGLDKYQFEVINIMKMASNLVNFTREFIMFVREKMIDKDNHIIFNLLAEKI